MAQSEPPFPIDLEGLLLPISDKHPSGEWLRYEGSYDKIQDARRADDASLPQGVWKTTQKRADWALVSKLCQEALRTRSKDLQIAAWLLEAWLHLYGGKGLTGGVRLVDELCQRFWDTLFPELDPDDASFRTAPIEWIDQRLPLTLKLLPLTAPQGEGTRPICYSDWELMLRREKVEQMAPRRDEDEEGEQQQQPARPQLLLSAQMTPSAVLRGRSRDLEEALSAIRTLEEHLDQRLGPKFVVLRQMRETITDIRRLLHEFGGEGEQEEQPTQEPQMADDFDEEAQPAEADPAPARPRGPIKSRAEAYRRLEEVADYLLRTEPHSPTPYLVKRAVSWGNMSLSELLGEIVASQGDLRSIYQLLGMRGQGSSE